MASRLPLCSTRGMEVRVSISKKTRCYDVSYTLFHLTASLPVCFHIDETGVLFAALTLIVLKASVMLFFQIK